MNENYLTLFHYIKILFSNNVIVPWFTNGTKLNFYKNNEE